MAPGQKPRDQKIVETLGAIKSCGWRSTNQFIEAFYASGEATQSLRYQPDSTYGPERIMTAWSDSRNGPTRSGGYRNASAS